MGGFELAADEVNVARSDREGFSVASESGYLAAVTTTISSDLAAEGTARELVHIVQNMRKAAGFDIADHIVTSYEGPSELGEVVEAHGEYIRQETLSNELVAGRAADGAHVENHKVNGLEAVLGVKRV